LTKRLNDNGEQSVKYFALVLTILTCLLLTGCKKEAAIDKFVSDLDTHTGAIVKAVDDSPTAAGADAAQKLFDAKRAELRAQFEDLVKGKASTTAADKLTASIKANVAAVLGLQSKYRLEGQSDEAFRTKLEKLGKDYLDMLKTE
jgi:outer membrane murein-binding lipoprotein Lpp